MLGERERAQQSERFINLMESGRRLTPHVTDLGCISCIWVLAKRARLIGEPTT
ncbi:uncharacterized protein EI90DRAFT_3065644 [Cantharellus anzutake]|uniref:uncharacterized protein n=1 Tax=Cantharellus anzutake TaxID=1750568 RepID=UPI001906171B|nr:uncharacterized protein EI90DRAFT_3065644 [Cantharellus anzutake]KAF8328112.1 hypothetical protein EI90DRAFT_3065644 [Cantharellus anzutake]